MSASASNLPVGQRSAKETPPPRAPYKPLSEKIADAIRAGDYERLGELSPYAGCLLPLLHALGWVTCDRDILEALPHFSDTVDLVTLRNMLVELGYRSDPLDIDTHTVPRDMLPCLFSTHRGHLYVLKEQSEFGVRAFCSQRRTDVLLDAPLKGTAYLFTDTHVTHAVVPERPDEDWFGMLLRRFQGLIKHLLGTTLLLNVIALAVPIYIMLVYDRLIGTRDVTAVPAFMLGITFVLAVEFGLRYLRAKMLGITGSRIDYLIGTETVRQILSLPPIMTERSTITSQLSRLRQFDSVREFFSGPTANLVLESPFVLIFVIVIGILGGWLAAIPLLAALAFALVTGAALPRVRELTRHAGAAKTNREQSLMETLNGLRELKSLGAEAIWHERFRETSADTAMAHLRTADEQASLQAVTTAMTKLAGTVVIAVGASQVIEGTITVGALIAILALLWRVLGPLQALCMTYVRFEQILMGVQGINQLMRLNSERHRGRSVMIKEDCQGAIRFDRVSFRYSREADPALIGVSFTIEPGEFVILRGQNSSGKSTILKLIGGLYAVPSGTVSIDGVDTRQFNTDELRRLIAYMPQHPRLFHGTLAQNLRLKNILATEQDLRAACEAAGVLDDVLALPGGLEVRIGDHTTRVLPNGLIRGMCLARTLLRPSPILLLDEPTAGVDRVRDRQLTEQFRKLKGKMTVVMVSNRTSHVALADKVIDLANGMISSISKPGQS
ncbi:MAG: ABC transporter transmembrane domain-containing protein [Pseudomonadota bacterium]